MAIGHTKKDPHRVLQGRPRGGDNFTSLFQVLQTLHSQRQKSGSHKPCFCPLPKRGHFDENGENDEFALYPLKTRVWLLRPPKTTKMTKMASVTQEKAWFRKGRVCSSLNKPLSYLKSCHPVRGSPRGAPLEALSVGSVAIEVGVNKIRRLQPAYHRGQNY